MAFAQSPRKEPPFPLQHLRYRSRSLSRACRSGCQRRTPSCRSVWTVSRSQSAEPWEQTPSARVPSRPTLWSAPRASRSPPQTPVQALYAVNNCVLTLAIRGGLLFVLLLWSSPEGIVGVLIEHWPIEVIKDGLGSLLLFLPWGATWSLGRV